MSAGFLRSKPRPILLALLMIISSISPLLINIDWSQNELAEQEEDPPQFAPTSSGHPLYDDASFDWAMKVNGTVDDMVSLPTETS